MQAAGPKTSPNMASALKPSSVGAAQHRQSQHHPQGLPALKQPLRSPRHQTSVPRPLGLQRTFTLRHQLPPTTACAALPLPAFFLEINVSVLDSLDLVRSTMEEEVVFQATLQVPAHQALACRVEAYDSPFATPPALNVAPGQLSEADRQFAACMAAPPEVEEAHHPQLARQAANTNNAFQTRTAPSVRFASGALTVSLSLRQRSNDVKRSAGAGTEADEDLEEAIEAVLAAQGSGGSSTLATRNSLSSSSLSRPSSLSAAPPSAATHQGSSRTAAAAGKRGCESIPEASACGEGDAASASQHAAAPQQQQQQHPDQPRGLLRMESFTAAGRCVMTPPAP